MFANLRAPCHRRYDSVRRPHGFWGHGDDGGVVDAGPHGPLPVGCIAPVLEYFGVGGSLSGYLMNLEDYEWILEGVRYDIVDAQVNLDGTVYTFELWDDAHFVPGNVIVSYFSGTGIRKTVTVYKNSVFLMKLTFGLDITGRPDEVEWNWGASSWELDFTSWDSYDRPKAGSGDSQTYTAKYSTHELCTP